MENIELEKLKYPIGKFHRPEKISEAHLGTCIDELEMFPKKLAYT